MSIIEDTILNKMEQIIEEKEVKPTWQNTSWDWLIFGSSLLLILYLLCSASYGKFDLLHTVYVGLYLFAFRFVIIYKDCIWKFNFFPEKVDSRKDKHLIVRVLYKYWVLIRVVLIFAVAVSFFIVSIFWMVGILFVFLDLIPTYNELHGL